MKRIGVSACIWLASAVLAGCAGEATYSGDVRVTSPELVAVQPGVEVVADADEPLFYVDGYYWLYRDGVWLRSDSYRNGFARIDVNIVPVSLRQIPEPRTYAHFNRSERGKEVARGSKMPERTAQRPQRTDRYQPPAAPQPPEPARPAQPNPMPDRQQQQQPDQGRPQGAETGNTPQTGGENQDRDQRQDQRQGEGMDRGRDLDMPSHAQQRDKDKDKDKDKPINKKDPDQDR